MAESKKASAPKVSIDVEHIDFESRYKPHQKAFDVGGKDPEFDYRWVRATPERIASLQRTGFDFVQKSEVSTVKGADPDGKIRVSGKEVLMRRPKSIGDQHRDFLRKKAAGAVAAPRESFKSKASRANVETYDTTQAVLGPPSGNVSANDD